MPRSRRTLIQRAQAIFRYINTRPTPFPKSQLQDIGFNPTTAEDWLRLIEYIQSQPRIKVTKMGSNTYIERIENNYLSLLRKRVLDDALSFQERSKTMDDYINALIVLERTEDGRLKKIKE